MNASQALAGEAIVALGYVSWRNVKGSYAPLPNQIVKSGVSFMIIGVVAYASPELASLVGAGLLLALLVKEMQRPTDPNATQAPAGYSHDNLIMFGPPKTNVPGAKG